MVEIKPNSRDLGSGSIPTPLEQPESLIIEDSEMSLVPVTTDAEFREIPDKKSLAVKGREFERIFDYIRPHEARTLIEATTIPRDHLLFNMLWQTGCRISEGLSLRPADVTDAGLHIITLKKRLMVRTRTITGKWKDRDVPKDSKKTMRRTIPLKPELKAEIHKYAFETHMTPSTPFFEITPRWAELTLKKLAIKTGITHKKLTPHLFRHGFAVNWINQGGSINKLQYLLGHNSIQTTLIYLRLSNIDIARDFERMVF